MSKLILLSLLNFSILNCSGQNTKYHIIKYDSCKSNWQYFDLQDTIQGQVLFHSKSRVACGILATASLTVIKTATGDTLRILEMCNTFKNFAKSAQVQVFPAKRPSFGVLFPPDNAYTCKLRKSCYGVVKSMADKPE